MPHGTSKNEHPQSDNVGAGSARPNASTYVPVSAFRQANPAPTDNLVKCEHSSFFNF